jgi:colanic acid biosynthesis protein WcaH
MRIPDELYDQIRQVMPISCVDLLVKDQTGQVLLVKRKNDPAAGDWWFPGGRVHFNETRRSAAIRKLKEECDLQAVRIVECGTYDVIFGSPGKAGASHGITTVFLMYTTKSEVRLDHQSEESQWRLPNEWEQVNLHPFVRQCMTFINDGIEVRG